jgi:hypothetical protein
LLLLLLRRRWYELRHCRRQPVHWLMRSMMCWLLTLCCLLRQWMLLLLPKREWLRQ